MSWFTDFLKKEKDKVLGTVKNDADKVSNYFGIGKPGLGTFGQQVKNTLNSAVSGVSKVGETGNAKDFVKLNDAIRNIKNPTTRQEMNRTVNFAQQGKVTRPTQNATSVMSNFLNPSIGPKAILPQNSQPVPTVKDAFGSLLKAILYGITQPTVAGEPSDLTGNGQSSAIVDKLTPQQVQQYNTQKTQEAIQGSNAGGATNVASTIGDIFTLFSPYTIGTRAAGKIQNATTPEAKVGAGVEALTALLAKGAIGKTADLTTTEGILKAAQKSSDPMVKRLLLNILSKTPEAAGIGAGFGLSSGLQNNGSAKEVAESTGEGALYGLPFAVLGGTLQTAKEPNVSIQSMAGRTITVTADDVKAMSTGKELTPLQQDIAKTIPGNVRAQAVKQGSVDYTIPGEKTATITPSKLGMFLGQTEKTVNLPNGNTTTSKTVKPTLQLTSGKIPDESGKINFGAPLKDDGLDALRNEARKKSITAYHGTNANFDNFDNKFLGSATGKQPINMSGFSFSSDKNVAKTFGKNVKKVELDIQNPYVIDAKGKTYGDEMKTIIRDAVDTVDRNKYDGIIIKNYKDAGTGTPKISDHYIPFSEKQISQSLSTNKGETALRNEAKTGRFHGTSSEIKNLMTDEEMYSPNNIYGQGFYTTDNYSVAGGYAKKGGGSTPTIYDISEKAPVKLFDMEKPVSDNILKKINDTGLFMEGYQKGTTLREIYDDIRAMSSSKELSIDEAQGLMNEVKGVLSKEGYRGLDHTGGLITKGEKHNVKIYWNPKEDLNITQSLSPNKGKTVNTSNDKFNNAIAYIKQWGTRQVDVNAIKSDFPDRTAEFDKAISEIKASEATKRALTARENEYGNKLNSLANNTQIMSPDGTLNNGAIRDFQKAEYELAKQYPDLPVNANKIAYYEKTHGISPNKGVGATTPPKATKTEKGIRLPLKQEKATEGLGTSVLPAGKGLSDDNSLPPVKPSVKPSVPKSSEEIRLQLPAGDPETARNMVRANLQGKLDNIEQRIYGSTTSGVTGGTKGAGIIGKVTLPLQEKVSSAFAKGLSSKNPIIRNISRGVKALFGQTGKTVEGETRLGLMKGADDTAIQLANDVESYAKGLVGGSEESLRRIHSVLDPEISSIKVNAKDLTEKEKQATNFLREISDYINDSNFAQGKISYETWQKGTGGRYITRAYDEIELPPELSGAFKDMARGKQELGMFKQRGDVTDWKLDHAIEDPAYLVGKRLQQTYRNEQLAKYADWVVKQPDMVSDVERTGYTKLSDSPVWGALSGKNVRQDIVEGIRGFYSDNKAVQGLYDLLNWYDKLAPRRFLKKVKTVFNPVTRLGNQIGNRVFGLMNGINPFTFEKNIQTFAKKDLAENGQITRLLRQNGVLGTDFTRTELVNRLAKAGVDKNTLQKIDEYITKSYGAADDHAKIAAMKYWLDKGKTVEEALRKVRAGFQNYQSIGLLYDIGAKIPVFGNAFVRFQGDLIRMLKNSALENPLGLVGMIGAIYAGGKLSSKLSGESEEDYKTRTTRLGVPRIPYTNVPLEIQTRWGAVNAARLFGLYDITPAGEGIQNRISRQMPIQIPTNKKELGSALTSDPLVGPIIGALANIDFRGKSVRDPNENVYQPTTLTPAEQNLNRLGYLGRSYGSGLPTDITNVVRANMGLPDIYGKEKTPTQAALRMAGVKVEQFGPEQAQKERDTQAYFEQSRQESIGKKISQIIKDKLIGKIDEKTANARIKALGGGTASQEGKMFEYNGKTNVIINGDRKEFDTPQEAQKAIDKDSFDKSGKKSALIDGTYYYRDKNGKAQDMPEADYKYKVRNEKMTTAKINKDYKTWLKLADEKLKDIEAQFADADPLTQSELQNDYDTLVNQITKYRGQGGFTKPKTGKAPTKLTINAPKVQATYKKISAPKIGGTNGKVSAPNISRYTIQPRKIGRVRSPR